MWNEKQHQEGNILISALLILLVINLLSVVLIGVAVKDGSVANYKSVEAKTFHVAESCTQDMIAYVRLQTGAITTPYTISAADLSHMYTGNETAEELVKLAGYSFTCTLTEITSKTLTASSTGIGDALGDGDGYSSDRDLEPKYYYQIVSTSSGPNNSTKTINTIISVDF